MLEVVFCLEIFFYVEGKWCIMAEKLKRRYGLLTATCLVVGTVIGSGIFFRNVDIFAAIGGNMAIGIAAWVVGGLITLSFAYVFGTLAAQDEEASGLSYFARKLVGERFGYIMNWYMATMFMPSITGVLAWISGSFTTQLFFPYATTGVNAAFSGHTYIFALFYLVAIYVMNELSPKLSEKFHVSCTFIKVIPLIGMGIIGTIVGLINGTTAYNLTYVPVVDAASQAVESPFFAALLATAFAYLGWDVVVSLSKEIKDVKKNLPKALTIGMIIVITIYVAYFVGLFSAAPVESLGSQAGIRGAFEGLFGNAAGTILFVFIIISCLGTLNGLVMASGRMFYILSSNNTGPRQEIFSQLDRATKMPANSMALSLLIIAFWMLVSAGNHMGIYGDFVFNVPNLMPISFKAFMIPIFIAVMIKVKSLNVFNRFIAPLVAMAGAAFLVYAIIYREGTGVLVFAVIFTVLTGIGLLFEKSKKRT